MPTDPSLILNAAENFPQIAPNPQTLINNQLGADKLTLFNQQQQGVNALKDLYSDPSNLVNGKPTPEALQKLTAAAPQQGLDLRRQLMQDDQTQVQLSLARAKEGDAVLRQKMIIAQEAQEDYQENLKTMTPAQALATTQRNVWTPGRAELAQSGLVSPDALTTMPSNFDPQRVGRSLNAWNAAMITTQQRFEQEEKLKSDRRADIELGIKQNKSTNEEFGKPETVTVPDENGQMRQTSATYDKVANNFREVGTGKILPGAQIVPAAQVMPGVPGGAASSTNLNGHAYLDTIPKPDADMVKALADGRMQFPSGFALRSPYWQNKITQVSQYDPSFDTINYSARAKTRVDFTSGASAKNLTSINTTIGHFGSLLKSSDALNNFRQSVIPGVTGLNAIKNWYLSNSGDPRIVRFEADKDAVTRELTRVFRGTGGNVADIKDWEKTISDASSPEQFHGAIQEGVNLLASRIQAVGDQYQRGMGKTSDPLQLLSKKAREELETIPGGKELSFSMSAPSGGEASPPGSVAGVPQANAPAGNAVPLPPTGSGVHRDTTKEQYDRLPSGALYTMPGTDKTFVKQ